MFTRRVHDRRFVWTWWAGMVPDSFGVRSIFHVGRVGVLRGRRVMPTGGVARRGTPVGVRQRGVPSWYPLLNCVPTQGFWVSRGLTDLVSKGLTETIKPK